MTKNLNQFINPLNAPIRVAECFAGNNPIPAVIFASTFPNMAYGSMDLVDHRDLYFSRAKSLSRQCGMNFTDFERKVKYYPNTNIFHSGLASLGGKFDVVLHWGMALRHMLPLDGERGIRYLQIRSEEASGVDLARKEELMAMHVRVKRRMDEELGLKKEGEYWTDESQLRNYLKSCRSVLESGGVIVTNSVHDHERIAGVMKSLDFSCEKKVIQFEGFNLEKDGEIDIWRL